MRAISFVLAVVVAASCADKTPATNDAQKTEPSAPARASVAVPTGDTLRGVVGVRGRDTLPALELQTTADTIALQGADLETLRRVIGFEITARGNRTTTHFDVASFVVRSLDGERVTDGILDVEQGVFFVRTADGERVNIGTIPGSLRGEIGSRVYLVGPLDRMPSAFGVITEGR